MSHLPWRPDRPARGSEDFVDCPECGCPHFCDLATWDQIAELHTPDEGGDCVHCHLVFPCPTMIILTRTAS